MNECKHVWLGSTNGVTCKECGKKLTHEEYLALFAPAEKKPTRRNAKK